MIRSTYANIKRACTGTFVPRILRSHVWYTSHKFEKLPGGGVLAVSPKSSKSGSTSAPDDEAKKRNCEKCDRIIKYVFDSRAEYPYSDITSYKKSSSDVHTENICQITVLTPPKKDVKQSETHEERCERIIGEIFGNETNNVISNANDEIVEPVSKLPLETTLQSTTVRENEEKLVHSIENIDASTLVTSEKRKVENFNTEPEVLNDKIPKEALLHAITKNENEEKLLQKIEKINEPPLVEAESKTVEQKFENEPKVLADKLTDESLLYLRAVLRELMAKQSWIQDPKLKNAIAAFATESGNRKSGSTPEFDELAKRCLESPTSQLDERILQEMEKLGVPQTSRKTPSNSAVIEGELIQMDVLKKPKKPIKETEIDLETRKIERDPINCNHNCEQPLYSLDETPVILSRQESQPSNLYTKPLILNEEMLDISEEKLKATADYIKQPGIFGHSDKSLNNDMINEEDSYNYNVFKHRQHKQVFTKVMEENNQPTSKPVVYSITMDKQQNSELTRETRGFEEPKLVLEIIVDPKFENFKQIKQDTESNKNIYPEYGTSQQEHTFLYEKDYKHPTSEQEQTYFDEMGIKLPITKQEQAYNETNNRYISYQQRQANFYEKENQHQTSEQEQAYFDKDHNKHTVTEKDQDFHDDRYNIYPITQQGQGVFCGNMDTKYPITEQEHASFSEMEMDDRYRITDRKQAISSEMDNKYTFTEQEHSSFREMNEKYSVTERQQVIPSELDDKYPNNEHEQVSFSSQSVREMDDKYRLTERDQVFPNKVDNEYLITEQERVSYNTQSKITETKRERPEINKINKNQSETPQETRQKITQSNLSYDSYRLPPGPEKIQENISTTVGPLPCINLDVQNLPLSELLKLARARGKVQSCKAFDEHIRNIKPATLEEPVSARKCGQKPPPCPPPAPTCPPPDPCPPKPCPPPRPKCPKPCKPCCPNPCDPPCGPSTKKFSSMTPLPDCKFVVPVNSEADLPDGLILQDHSLNMNGYFKDFVISKNKSFLERFNKLKMKTIKNLVYAREFEPWTPIPCWPFEKKQVKRPVQCPKHGCPTPRPPRDGDFCNPLQKPCTGFPKRLTFS